MSTPATWAMFCKNTGLRKGSQDTLYFASDLDRNTWFTGKAITINGSKTITGLSYQRLENGSYKMRVPAPRQTLEECDYMVYMNAGHEARRMYCFIDDIHYVNEEMCEVFFTDDAFQTWIDDVTFKQSLVLREIVSSDDRFDPINAIPDYFNNAPLKTMYSTDINTSDTQGLYVVVAMTAPIYCPADKITDPEIAYQSNWTPQNISAGSLDRLSYYITKMDTSTHESALNKLNTILHYIDIEQEAIGNKGGGIIGFYISPSICIPDAVLTYINGTDGPTHPVLLSPGTAYSEYSTSQSDVESYGIRWLLKGMTDCNIAYSKSSTYQLVFSDVLVNLFGDGNNGTMTGYLPKNQKLYNAPYCKFRVKNNRGQVIDVPFQNMKESLSGRYNLTIRGAQNLFPKAVLTLPVETESENTDYRVTLDEYPTIMRTANEYAKWREQMLITAPFLAARIGVNALSAVASKSPYAVFSSITGVADKAIDIAQGERYAENTAPSANGTINGELFSQANNENKFTIELCSITYANAKAIDDYFTKYGYYRDILGMPYYGLNGRPAFGYIQTHEIGITGNIPMYAKDIIAETYNRGVRMWLPSKFLDYTQDNSIAHA